MAHLRTPIIQNYFNSFNITATPPALIQLCVSEDPPSPRQKTEKTQQQPRSTKKPPIFRFPPRNRHHQLMNSYLALNINTLTNLNSSGGDFEKDSGMVHALQFNDQPHNQLDQLETVASIFGDDPFSTKFESSFDIQDQQRSFVEGDGDLLIKVRKQTY